VRRRNGRFSGGSGGGSGGRNSQKITGDSGKDVKKATEALAPKKERKEGAECGADAGDAAGAPDAAAEAGWDGGMTPWVYSGCRPSTRIHGGGVGLVDNANERNKARAVVEIYRIPLGRYRWLTTLCYH